MPGQKRDRSRVKIIDWHIRRYYPEFGPDKIVEELGEDRKYIMQRAHYLKVRQIKKPAPPKKKQPTRKELMERIHVLEEQKKALRLELIKLTDRKRVS